MSGQQRLREDIDRELDRGVHLTHEIKKTTLDSHKTMNTTMETLNHQGEQLKRIERRTDGINEDVKTADESLKQVESMWYSWLPNFARKNRGAYSSKEMDKQPKGKSSVSSSKEKPGQTQKQGRYVERIAGDQREDVMNDDLTCVSHLLDDMYQSAQLMGRELDDQNTRLDRLNPKVEKLDHKVTDMNRRMHKELRK